MAAKSQARWFGLNTAMKAAVILVLIHLGGRIIALVTLLALTLVGYACYSLISYRKSPNIPSKPQKKFKFLEQDAWDHELMSQTIDSSKLAAPIVVSAPLVSEKLDQLTDLIVQNFIEGWYKQISTSSLFTDSVRLELKNVLQKLQSRLAGVNVPEFLVFRIVPLLTAHYNNFVTSANLHDSVYSVESKLATALSLAGADLHEGVSLSAPGPESRNQEKQYLRRLVQLTLPYLLLPEEFESPVTRNLVREILSCTVLANVLEAVSEGDLINQLIVNFIGSTLQRRKQVQRLREALQEHTRYASLEPLSVLPPLSLPLSAAVIRKWSETIQRTHTKSILEAIAVAIQNARPQILSATGEHSPEVAAISKLHSQVESAINSDNLSLDVILVETKKRHAFREFLRTTKQEYLLDIWTEVDQLKAPLEDMDLTEISLKLEFSNKNEIVRIYDKFFSIGMLKITPLIRASVEKFVFSDMKDAEVYKSARMALFELQDLCYQELKYIIFPLFQESEAFADLKAMSTTKLAARRAPSLSFKPSSAIGEDLIERPAELSNISLEVVNAVESAFEKIMENSSHPDIKPSLHVSLEDEDSVGVSSGSSLFGDSKNLNFQRSNCDINTNRLSRLFENNSDSESEDTSFDSNDMSASGNLSDSQLINLEVLLAAPGDLKLEEQIAILDKDIETLAEQSEILVSLIKKAELTNNLSELKVLRRSNASLEREIGSKELQKQQYIVQENENSLFGKSKVRIQSCVLSSEEHHSYALYIIEVQKFSSENPTQIVAGWVVARRFSQFYKLNEYLKRRCPAVAEIKFPKKAVPYLQFQKVQQIEVRKPILEQYLKSLLSIPDVCANPVFRSFLSSEHFDLDRKDKAQSKDGIFNRFYKEFAPKASALSSMREATESDEQSEEILQHIRDMERELKQFDDIDKSGTDKLPFIKPIFDLILAIFDLGARNWLRGRALLVILQQVLGSTIENTITSSINKVFDQEIRIALFIASAISMLFPNGKFRDPPKPRTRAEQLATRQEAYSILTIFMDDTCSKIFGSRHTNTASSNLLEMLQNDYLNKSLLLKVIDVTFNEIFPEMAKDASELNTD
ncbi:hypothetical protein PUMCH_004685 [Australozyma saopauloensis]|uniref:Uncharacterized protein n=1 Tax=Australozyma saopauloensis TaxID=291208 RepID=A0AAX4HG60_9ASCO|nr:hypothetical protein PUMCH_004685 [[Candida] saopauloensis]